MLMMDQAAEGNREELRRKLQENFDGRIVRKDLTKKIKEGANVPGYVLEFLLGQYCSSDDEEIIEQGAELARIHPQSINTLRIPTVVLADGSVRLFHPTLRVGRGDGIIDNFSAGGISALIDPETGCICSDGADKKGRRYAAHPDTGVRFDGYRLPEWDKAVAMVTTAAHMVPGNHYCGWDLAYSTHGWCMVEANCTAQMGGMQIITQTGRKADLEALIAQM